MRAERETDVDSPPAELDRAREHGETLTDLIDRMDREAFKRSLEQREPRVVSSAVKRP